jgi:2-dehydro-3-deoxygalactonokinase
VQAAGREIVAEFRSDQGVARLAQSADNSPRAERFRTVLAQGLRPLRDRVGDRLNRAPVMISGMASSSIGWQELPYAPLPLALDGSDLVWQELEPLKSENGPRRIILISGACTERDVMRGEETQALGAFQLPLTEKLAGGSLLIMPGTHSKHLHVEAGQVRTFQTFMTDELFEVLGQHSILQHSLGLSGPISSELAGDSLAAFREGVDQVLLRGLSASLFRVRTRQLLDKLPENSNRAFLSGALVGSELAYLQQAKFSGRPILLCASAPLDTLYASALDALALREQLTIVAPADVARLSALGQGVLLRNLDGL